MTEEEAIRKAFRLGCGPLSPERLRNFVRAVKMLGDSAADMKRDLLGLG
jgi:hypothetical protein